VEIASYAIYAEYFCFVLAAQATALEDLSFQI